MLTNSPCIVVGSTYHVSVLKGVTIAGLGKENLVTVPVDKNARLDANGTLKMGISFSIS